MKHKTVLFTFDYELFLGVRSGQPGDCIIAPTNRLLQLLGNADFKGVFFVDTVYLIRLEEAAEIYEAASRDLSDIRQQLEEIVRQGHAIFPHIHAHWLDAIYISEDNEWSLTDTRYYQFASLDTQRQRVLFDKSVEIIRSITGKFPGCPEIDSYRAGGWSIQPFSHFKPHLLRHGITQEWSVIPGKYHFSSAHFFDFRKAPSGTPVYRFENDPCEQDDNGYFTEWTISTLSLTPFEKWINFKIGGLLRRLGLKKPVKGSTVSSVTKEEGDVQQRGNVARVTASFEGLNPFTLRKYLSVIRKEDYFHFISHPKLLSPFEFTMIEKLFISLRKKNSIQTDFRKVAL